jgi:hypothetical protein
MTQFVQCLEAKAAPPNLEPAPEPGSTEVEAPPAPIDLLSVSGSSLVRRLAPPAALAAALLLWLAWRR